MSVKLLKDSAIIHGNNEFGRYIKFSNGVLICWRYVSTTPTYISQWGNLFHYEIQNFQFPYVFADAPFVQVSNIGGHTFLTGQIQRNEARIIKAELMKNEQSISNCEFYILAVGRWK